MNPSCKMKQSFQSVNPWFCGYFLIHRTSCKSGSYTMGASWPAAGGDTRAWALRSGRAQRGHQPVSPSLHLPSTPRRQFLFCGEASCTRAETFTRARQPGLCSGCGLQSTPAVTGRLIKHKHPCEATTTGCQGCAYHLFSKPCGYPDPVSRTDLGARVAEQGPPQTPHLQSALLSTKPREKSTFTYLHLHLTLLCRICRRCPVFWL